MTKIGHAMVEHVAGRVLVYTRTTGYRHESIPAGVAALRRIDGLSVDATEDPGVFTADRLAGYRAVVWLSTTGEVLSGPQRDAFAGWVAAGGGWVGVHSAADTERDWPWYGRLVGAWFAGHPPVQPGTVTVADADHPATAHLPARWARTDEWYDYTAVPPPGVRVLLRLDEGSYAGGRMGADHPIAWCHTLAGGRAFYTGGGHTTASYAEPAFVRHLHAGVRWAAYCSG